MIGSKRKVLSSYKALEEDGIEARKFDRVHAPVGLEIGALTPNEIAISIAAELIAVRRNADAGLQHKAVDRQHPSTSKPPRSPEPAQRAQAD
jgi:xanthine dehydrogenase accessory factor